jgi:hypothetical protein
MKRVHEELKPGTYVEVLTKQNEDGQNFSGTIISAAPNAPDTYIVEYQPGLDNGHHPGNELKVIHNLPGQVDNPQEVGGKSKVKSLFQRNIGHHASILTDKEWKLGGRVLGVEDEFVTLETTESEQILHVVLSKVVCVYFQNR